MKINFDEIEEKVLLHFHDGEGEAISKAFVNGDIRIMKNTLNPGCSNGTHKHEKNFEIIYEISGASRIVVDGKEEILHPGEAHLCPRGSTHSQECYGEEPAVCLCIVAD